MRKPDIAKGDEIEFVRGIGREGVEVRRYKGRVKQVTGDAAQITVTDERWAGARETVVRMKHIVDQETGDRFSLKPAIDMTIAVPKPPPLVPMPHVVVPVPSAPPLPDYTGEAAEMTAVLSGSTEKRVDKNDVDAWFDMGKEMLASIDDVIENKKGEVLLLEEEVKTLVDQRNNTMEEIKVLEARKLKLAAFYKEEKS